MPQANAFGFLNKKLGTWRAFFGLDFFDGNLPPRKEGLIRGEVPLDFPLILA